MACNVTIDFRVRHWDDSFALTVLVEPLLDPLVLSPSLPMNEFYVKDFISDRGFVTLSGFEARKFAARQPSYFLRRD